MAKTSRKRAKAKTAAKPKGRGKPSAAAAWRAAAAHSLGKPPRGMTFQCNYIANAGLDAPEAIARLDRELTALGIPYFVRFFGMRDRRATFRIVVNEKGFEMWEAVKRVGTLGRGRPSRAKRS